MKESSGPWSIENETIRVTARKHEGQVYLTFEHRDCEGRWRMVLATGLETEPGASEEAGRTVCINDPVIDWCDGYQTYRKAGLFDQAALEADGRELVLRAAPSVWGGDTRRPHEIVQRVSLTEWNTVHVTVTDRITDACSEIGLGKLMNCFYFTPDGRAKRGVEPLDFAWIPALHWDVDNVVGDHVFRSPAAIVQFDGAYAALVPDLDLLAEARPTIRHALDLRVGGVPQEGEPWTASEVPRLYYGFCTWECHLHTYYRHDADDRQRLSPGELSYGFDLFLGRADGPEEVTERVNTYFWARYGRKYFDDIRPQVLPFEQYGRKHAYVKELPMTVRRASVGGKDAAGIHNPGRRGSNFHAWENDLVMGFGIRHYADKWGDADLRQTADGMRQLILSAPRRKGAFPCIFNFDAGRYEGSLRWTAAPADPYDGYDTAAMGVTSWWMFYWHQHFGGDPELLESALSYARFLVEVQQPSGGVPTYFFADFKPAKPLLESGTAAISGAVLAEAARLTGDAGLKQAALAAGRFVDEQILPPLMFYDFETFYSCSPKPIHWLDPVSGIRPQNNLCLQWICDQFLALHKLTEDEHWLRRGEYALGLLSFYQQVWTPPYYNTYLFGGFGVMNTDGEWNDGRQARFAPTYADYYEATGKLEYLERAIAACRASFALMDIEENHANAINHTVQQEPDGSRIGRAPENVFHMGPGDSISGWSGFNWSAGGGLTASAYLERQFGTVWVDGQARKAVPVDGVTASVVSWDGTNVSLAVASALTGLASPYDQARDVVVKFGRLPAGNYTVTINGQKFKDASAKELGEGLNVQLS